MLNFHVVYDFSRKYFLTYGVYLSFLALFPSFGV